MPGVRLTGQWQQFLRTLDPVRFEQRLKREVRKATLRNAMLVRREILQRIRDRKYVENAPLTLMAKAPKSKPLVNTGGLFQAITQELASEFLAFVGIKFGAKGKDGQDWVNVAIKLHEGFTLDVTPAMRRAVFAKIRKNSRGAKMLRENPPAGPAKTTWVIPARPFIREVIEDGNVQEQIQRNWTEAVRVALFTFA